ncbi:hypothetical protein APS56_02890 [Pseudalgibacter alginicilyticus]|uniref:PpiC domain-containing protein n=1 Tax=Pseudalgibacter alginicilyticus TaxID=1736674 RepID=A0A0P0CMZ4_9FLAO|nr:peptidylprolyl isomerase [Pseudalgibacter alginicilyticus]ALJ04157.1 hypothetical protein APS56_02890 [Pseudalgibacter alginicilyticus]
MFKNLLTILFIAITSLLTAQTSLEKELEIIETPEQIDTFLKEKNSKKNKLITFNEEKHKTTLAKALFKLSKGGVEKTETEYYKTFYKVVDKTETINYRVSYIALESSNMKDSELKNIQSTIIKKYNDGASFDFLAKQYSSDKNANRGGDSGWFTQDKNNYDFEDVVINGSHSLNEIFTYNHTATNTYFIILKTYEPKTISEIKVLKVIENKD